MRKRGSRALRPFIASALDRVDWAAKGAGKPFYMVGGSWRALVQLDIYLTDYPLPVIQQYTMTPATPPRLVRSLARIDPKTLKNVTAISTSRLPSLPGAALLLAATIKRLGSSSVVASAYGLREGLLYERMTPAVQAEDPLIAAARDEGVRSGRFPEHGDLLMAWMDDVFAARRNARDAPPAAGDVPAQRRRVARPPRFPRRTRHGHRAARQLGGDRAGRARGAGRGIGRVLRRRAGDGRGGAAGAADRPAGRSPPPAHGGSRCASGSA